MSTTSATRTRKDRPPRPPLLLHPLNILHRIHRIPPLQPHRLSSPPPTHLPRSMPTRSRSTTEREADAYERLVEEDHAFGGAHWAPLVFAVVPGVGAVVVGGGADDWTEALVGLVVAFFLWQLAKVPWQLYSSARTARLLAIARSPVPPPPHRTAPNRTPLPLTRLSLPLLGLALLAWASPTTSNLLNRTSLVLYGLASVIRPLGHLVTLIESRISYLHSEIHPTEPLLEDISSTLSTLSEDIDTLRTTSATKTSLSTLRTSLDSPLGALSRAVRRSAKSEEALKLSAEERFAELDEIIDDLARRVAEAEHVASELERENTGLRSQPVAAASALLAQHFVNAGEGVPWIGGEGSGWLNTPPVPLLLLPLNLAVVLVAYCAAVVGVWGPRRAIGGSHPVEGKGKGERGKGR